jgi:hypothetical protein
MILASSAHELEIFDDLTMSPPSEHSPSPATPWQGSPNPQRLRKLLSQKATLFDRKYWIFILVPLRAPRLLGATRAIPCLALSSGTIINLEFLHPWLSVESTGFSSCLLVRAEQFSLQMSPLPGVIASV